MKRIVALLIALTLVFALVSCGDEVTGLDTVNSIYENSEPTKVVTVMTQNVGSMQLTGTYTLTVGQIDGKSATSYVAEYQEFDTVENNTGEYVNGPLVTVVESKEYVEGRGLRVNGGRWDTNGDNFAPEKGSWELVLTEELVGEYTFEDNVFTCVLTAENANTVFGGSTEFDSDVELSITTNGVEITGVSFSYVIDSKGDYPEIKVTVQTAYTYAIEAITLVK